MFSNRKIVLYIILIITVCIAAYVLIVVVPTTLAKRSYEGARQIGRDVREAFQFTPEITVNNTVVLEQQASILELATLSQKFQHRYEWTSEWMGSTKKIRIEGTFDAKAGFDLNKKFAIAITSDKAVVTLPEPQLLSLEAIGDIKFTDEHGVWNWVNQEDRSKALNEFHKDARRYAGQASFMYDIQPKMEEQLRQILLSHVTGVEFRYTETVKRDL
jgi:hypothetical protein